VWDHQGRAPYVLFSNGTRQRCKDDGRRLGTNRVLGWRACGTRSNGRDEHSSRAAWLGNVLEDHHDASGLLYRRNRYYNPQTGRFTQEDPIGLAGGVNVYGFANGDPVTYSDPYGLCPPIADCIAKLKQSAFTLGDVLHGLYDPSSMSLSYLAVQDANQWGADPSRLRYTAGQQNAFRHVAGSCQLFRYTGNDLGRTAATLTAHEIHLHTQTSANEEDSKADMHNNEIGVREAANTSNDRVSCDQIADRAIASGAAAIVSAP
jgi:RHS repeat-associated protein